MPYPNDLRVRVISAIQAGEPCREVAARYGLSVSAVGKWVLRFRRTGAVAAKGTGGDRQRRLDSEREWIFRRILTEPELTSRQLHQELSARGIRVGYRAVERFFEKTRTDLASAAGAP